MQSICSFAESLYAVRGIRFVSCETPLLSERKAIMIGGKIEKRRDVFCATRTTPKFAIETSGLPLELSGGLVEDISKPESACSSYKAERPRSGDILSPSSSQHPIL